MATGLKMEHIAHLATLCAHFVHQLLLIVQFALNREPAKHISMELPVFQPVPTRPTNRLLPIFAPIVILSVWSVRGQMIMSAVHA